MLPDAGRRPLLDRGVEAGVRQLEAAIGRQVRLGVRAEAIRLVGESSPGAVPAQSLETLLDKILGVDMQQVREEIAAAEAGQSDT